MFEKATRLKLRFDTGLGLLSVEDLWDLPLQRPNGNDLDHIARELYSKLKVDLTVSFVEPAKPDVTTQLAFDLVKHIIDVKVKERGEAALATANRAKKQQLMGLIADKENSALASMPLEDLRKMVEDL